MDPEPVYSEPPIAKAIYSIIYNAYPVPGKGSAPEADSYPPGPVIVRTDPVAKAADLVVKLVSSKSKCTRRDRSSSWSGWTTSLSLWTNCIARIARYRSVSGCTITSFSSPRTGSKGGGTRRSEGIGWDRAISIPASSKASYWSNLSNWSTCLLWTNWSRSSSLTHWRYRPIARSILSFSIPISCVRGLRHRNSFTCLRVCWSSQINSSKANISRSHRGRKGWSKDSIPPISRGIARNSSPCWNLPSSPIPCL